MHVTKVGCPMLYVIRHDTRDGEKIVQDWDKRKIFSTITIIPIASPEHPHGVYSP